MAESPVVPLINPEAHRLHLDARRQLPVQQAVLHAGRAAVGEVTPDRRSAGARRSPGPWRTAAADLLRNRAALAAAAVLLLVIAGVPVRAAVRAPHRAHRPVPVPRLRHHRRRREDRAGAHAQQHRPRPRRHPDRPDLGPRPLLPRRRQPGPRRHGPAAVRRPQQPVHRASPRRCSPAWSRRPSGVVAGYAGGVVDAVLSRILDVIWAFPVYLLAICLSVVLLTNGLQPRARSPSTREACWLPIAIIAVIYVPYVARPLRGQVMVAAQQGVHPGGHRLRRARPAHPAPRGAAERRCPRRSSSSR